MEEAQAVSAQEVTQDLEVETQLVSVQVEAQEDLAMEVETQEDSALDSVETQDQVQDLE